MSLRNQIERKVASRAGVGGARIGGAHFPPMGVADTERDLKALENAVAALRAGLLNLADEIDKRDRASRRAA
jgi:hypothetical protein